MDCVTVYVVVAWLVGWSLGCGLMNRVRRMALMTSINPAAAASIAIKSTHLFQPGSLGLFLLFPLMCINGSFKIQGSAGI